MRHPPAFLILETGRPVPSLRRHGGFPHLIRSAAGLSRHQARFVPVLDGHAPPDPRGFAGVIVTGSGAMVTDGEPWSEATADWLRKAHAHGLPILGICYGHQLIAHAFGGEVGWNPQGREMGTVPVRLHDEAARDPLFAAMPAEFPAQTTHLQTVLSAPPGAVVLAHSALDGCQAFRLGERTWGLQFHPEFGVVHMRGYIEARREALQREGHCHARMLESVRPAPAARAVLRRFVRHALAHRHG
ncbi:MAG TPA: glutamine amidotransferase [Xanthomonadaceae bacterium]|nr:glutamine amidotransferase [Xanthomonadaceae bacterium]